MLNFKSYFRRDVSHTSHPKSLPFPLPLTFALALTFCSLHAADMSGDFNTWLGYIAGINADGNRSTVMGAGAGGEATGIVRTDFMGAAAGAYSSNLTDCIGIGFRSLMNSSDMSEVVAIGTDAFTNRTGLTKATWINGQFVAYGQNNTFAIRAKRETPETNAPIYYADGVLNLNAAEIRFNGTTASSGGMGGASDPMLAGYDLYVDCVNGNDSYAGTTLGTAKRTIDGAYAAVTNHDATICLLPGIHLAPTSVLGGSTGSWSNIDYPAYRVHLVAPYGKEKTVIDGEGLRSYWGCSYPFSSIKGCTLRNMVSRKMNRPVFFAVFFLDCDIDASNNPVMSNYATALFEYCVLEKCFVIGGVSQQYSDEPEGSMSSAGAIIESSDSFDTVFDLATTGMCKSVTRNSHFENCFFRIGKVWRFSISETDGSVLGNESGFFDSTVVCPALSSEYVMSTAVGCLLGLGSVDESPAYGRMTESVCTNAATVAALIQSDYRPPVGEWRFRFVGYGSAADRAVKNSMENSIIDALLKNEDLNITQTARMNLMRSVALNESIDAPRVVNRGTNSIPVGTVFQLLPDPDESPAID
ncbi:MAG: hypothetical protein J6S05_01090 [Bacteroidaceae bacterium]|nr:hypothetical protein [Bacteroidaceae bacterium]